jgi:hypothetical protein
MTTQTNGTHSTSTVEGTVSRTNDRGVLLQGGSWLNVSRYAGGLLLPDVGAHVRVVLDGQGFIRAITPLEPSVSTGEAAAVPVDTQPHTPPDRETQATRVACLATAVAVCTAGGRVPDLAAVLATAAQLERWVTR